MVLVGDKKYACETCIKGHRSSTCKHTDRPLFEIKKKGRPVTQCEHCRELRKTKQVHVKCNCEARDDGDSLLSSGKKGGKKLPETAAFPSGLPPVLGASVAVHPQSEGSDSEYTSESSAKPCTCKSDDQCSCWTPRTSRNRRQSKASRKSDKDTSASDSQQPHQPAGLVASAHSKEYRPVLPRPSSGSRASPPHSSHSPTTAPHSNRAQLFYSPYGRAYEYAHGADVGPELTDASLQPAAQVPQLAPAATSYPTDRSPVPSYLSDWLSTVQQPTQLPPPPPSVLCDCGPNCACPGCVVHRGASADPQAFASCTNPTTCSACLECTMLSLAQNPLVEEWLRGEFPQLGDDISQGSSASPTVPSPHSLFDAVNQVMQQAPSEMRFDPQTWQSYALWSNLQGQAAAPSPPEDCCTGQCKCSQGMCNCPPDCCGCCAGCSCANCTHEDPMMGSGKTLTFALSAQREACCGRKSPRSVSETQQAGPSSGSRSVLDVSQIEYQQAELDLRGIYEWNSSSSDVPRVSLSRASSASSRSSNSHHSLDQQSHYSSQSSVHRSAAVPATADAAVKSCCASLATMKTSAAATASAHSPIPPPYIPSPTEIVQKRTYQYDPSTDSAGMF